MSLRSGWVVLKSLKTPLRNIKMALNIKTSWSNLILCSVPLICNEHSSWWINAVVFPALWDAVLISFTKRTLTPLLHSGTFSVTFGHFIDSRTFYNFWSLFPQWNILSLLSPAKKEKKHYLFIYLLWRFNLSCLTLIWAEYKLGTFLENKTSKL